MENVSLSVADRKPDGEVLLAVNVRATTFRRKD